VARVPMTALAPASAGLAVARVPMTALALAPASAGLAVARADARQWSAQA
jgi:hypothetical protein